MKSFLLILSYVPHFLNLIFKEFAYKRYAKNHTEQETREFAYRIAKEHVTKILNVTKAKVKVLGAENIDYSKPTVFIGNHQSLFDVVVLLSITERPTIFVAKKELSEWPVFGKWMLRMGCIFLDREDPREGVRVINEAARRVREEGCNAAIYPEGTRSRGPVMREFQRGSFKLVQRAEVPFIPTVIDNSYAVYESDKKFHSGETITISFLKPIDMSGMTREEEKNIHVTTQEIMQKELERIRSL